MMALVPRLQHIWQTRGPIAWLLSPLSGLFALVTSARRRLYRAGVFRTRVAPVPVIVVGNLIAGGAGKTPVVMAIVSVLRAAGYTPGIVSRGYGGSTIGPIDVTPASSAAESGDEPLLLHLRTGAAVVVGRNRPCAVTHLLNAHPQIDVVIADDGLQHLALGRDVQVLVFDERGAGNGWLLPAGPLREPMPERIPQRSLVVYNAASPSTSLPGFVARRRLLGAVSLADWRQGQPALAAALEPLQDRPLVAVAGLARPDRFFDMLRDAGLHIEPLVLPDHHDYASLPWSPETPDVILTEKDAVKLDPAGVGTTRVWVAPLDLGFDAGFDAALLALLPMPGKIAHGNTTA